jgi:hypothetical protein
MRRGILILSGTELIELSRHIDSEKFRLAARNVKEQNKILVNDEELEDILDEVGKPEDNEILNEAINKVSEILLSLRNR